MKLGITLEARHGSFIKESRHSALVQEKGIAIFALKPIDWLENDGGYEFTNDPAKAINFAIWKISGDPEIHLWNGSCYEEALAVMELLVKILGVEEDRYANV